MSRSSPLQIICREEWDAVVPHPDMPVNPSALPNVLLTYTDTDPCTNDDDCKQVVRETQTQHLINGMDDIQWNFMVGGDGRVYEGRGWEIAADKDTEFQQYYQKSIDIAYIGRFGEKHVIPKMEEAVKKLVQIGVDKSFIAKDHDYIGHKEHVGFQG